MKIIGLTGGIASGKSTVKTILLEAGFVVIDTDEIAHEQLLCGTVVNALIVKEFGQEILQKNGDIDRLKLGNIVFADDAKRKSLEGLLHPVIEAKVKKELKKLEECCKVVFLDVPLLFEVGWEKIVDFIWVVYVDLNVQLERLMKRNGYDEKTALMRISKQIPLNEKCKFPKVIVIDNRGSVEKTKKTVHSLLEKMTGLI